MEKKELPISRLDSIDVNIEPLVRDAKRYLLDFNEKKFRAAFYFAACAHEGQLRKENKPYIIHPVETVRILISLHADEDTLVAAFLHDVPEDTNHTIKEIETKFGKRVAFLVNGITKLSKVHFRNEMAKRQIESLKKLFIYTAEDPRTILIKLADRLHNMRTLQYVDKEEKRRRIARETLEIFAPVANLLGIEELKTELEDLCFRYLYPDEYENIADRMRRNRDKNKKILEETIKLVEKSLDKDKIKAIAVGRQKNFYSIYKKIITQGKRIDELDDFIALRVLVPEREDCYHVLGLIHTLFKPKLGKFKDYIAVPKVNGYQALHTTVFGLRGIITEFQIRTHKMHREAEYGIVANYFDEKNKNNFQLEKDRRSNWMSKIIELNNVEIPNESFLDNLKLDILQDRIFVFTPKGDPIDLPKDATCIDFAYAIHTQVGHRALKADVNNEIVSMTTVLKTGDTVRIITSDKAKGPDREWLFFAKTGYTKNKIMEYFRRESVESKVLIGKQLLQKEFDRAGLGFIENISHKHVRRFCDNHQNMGFKTLDDILGGIGDGTLSTLNFIHFLYPRRDIIQIGSFQISTLLKSKEKTPQYTQVILKVRTEDRIGQLEKLSRAISSLGLNIIASKSHSSWFSKNFICKFTVNVKSYQELLRLFESLEHIDGVLFVKRLFLRHRFMFILVSALTFVIWAMHPLLMYFITKDFSQIHSPIVAGFVLYAGLFMLFFLALMVKNITQRSFPEHRESTAFWILTFLLNSFALVTLFAEIYFFKLTFNWVLILGLILLIFAYLIGEYINQWERK